MEEKNVKVIHKKDGALIRFFKENMGILIALAVLIAFLAINPSTRESFLTQKNLFNVLRQISTNLYVACGMTLVIILGGIDLSVGSIIALSGCVSAAMAARHGLPIWISMIIGVVVGAIIGAINGAIISSTTIPAFIVTLATMNIAKGLAYVYTGGSPVRVISEEWQFLGAGYVGPIPVPVILLIIIVAITWFLMNRTKFGRHLFAVGDNPQAALFSGISIKNVKFNAHLYSGIMAGIAGIVLASRMYSGQPTAGDGAEMDAIAAAVVGGTSMSGGYGRIGGTVIGALIIGVLNNGLNLLNVNSFWQYVVKGFVILLAVFVDYIRNKNKK